MHQVEYCESMVSQLRALGIRAELSGGERLAKLIRNAETQKVPLMAVVGPKEVQSGTLNVRSRTSGDLGCLSVEQLAQRVGEAVRQKGFL